MQLMMFIGNDLIESIPLDQKQFQRPGYIGSFKRMLKLKYMQLIREIHEPVEFLILEPMKQPPGINNNTRSMPT